MNGGHSHHDLAVVLDTQDKRLFDRIDGHRSIAEIADHAGGAGRSHARTFFEMLWWYDQVVFDASSAQTNRNIL